MSAMRLVHSSDFTPDLFADEGSGRASLLAGFERAFEAWLSRERSLGVLRRESSEGAYRDLWQRLVRWSLSQTPPIAFEDLRAFDLELFLRSRHGAQGVDAPLSPRYAWRVLMLFDRVCQAQAQLGVQAGAWDGEENSEGGVGGIANGVEPAPPPVGLANPAAREVLAHNPEWRFANADLNDSLPDVLPADQAKRLVDYLSQARPRPGRAHTRLAWQVVRNRASVALQLGAGLTPGEVRAMPLAGVVVGGSGVQERQTRGFTSSGPGAPSAAAVGLPWKLRVPADGTTPQRETPLAPWAAQLLRHWLDIRAEQGIGGPYLFASTRSGKRWGKIGQYQAVGEVLEASGIDPDLVSGGSFRLRHTFAVRQMRRGHSAEDVARWLGVDSSRVMARYRRVLAAPVRDVV